jgi:hypothetical protein
MHFAAYAYVGESTAEPTKYYDNNIGGSAKLLQVCAAFDCRHFVFSSSCATYGLPERLPPTEDDLMFIRLQGDGTNNTARQLALWRQGLDSLQPGASPGRQPQAGSTAGALGCYGHRPISRSRFNRPVGPHGSEFRSPARTVSSDPKPLLSGLATVAPQWSGLWLDLLLHRASARWH